jgi:hypothetical protein
VQEAGIEQGWMMIGCTVWHTGSRASGHSNEPVLSFDSRPFTDATNLCIAAYLRVTIYVQAVQESYLIQHRSSDSLNESHGHTGARSMNQIDC